MNRRAAVRLVPIVMAALVPGCDSGPPTAGLNDGLYGAWHLTGNAAGALDTQSMQCTLDGVLELAGTLDAYTADGVATIERRFGDRETRTEYLLHIEGADTGFTSVEVLDDAQFLPDDDIRFTLAEASSVVMTGDWTCGVLQRIIYRSDGSAVRDTAAVAGAWSLSSAPS